MVLYLTSLAWKALNSGFRTVVRTQVEKGHDDQAASFRVHTSSLCHLDTLTACPVSSKCLNNLFLVVQTVLQTTQASPLLCLPFCQDLVWAKAPHRMDLLRCLALL
ncbi:unnamed protein product [Darwinula stevensoni]|uniref:Uncharacterized protein n=1 Tax=Darwinula stevensoni TaxID=69355 RepID=A0A7R9AAE8_9CRUS|nr:unnamed protein product [Darwinula stevensoni]CAG0898313.1 unnamed protein product [Darwinula stevensoni]